MYFFRKTENQTGSKDPDTNKALAAIVAVFPEAVNGSYYKLYGGSSFVSFFSSREEKGLFVIKKDSGGYTNPVFLKMKALDWQHMSEPERLKRYLKELAHTETTSTT